MARMVATKTALSVRVDALTDADGKSEPMAPSIGLENRAKLESRLRALEYAGDASGVRRFGENGKKQPRFEMTGNTSTYNTAADAVDLVSTKREPMELAVQAVLETKEEKRKEAQAEPNDDMILRILRMRPEAERYLKDRSRQKVRLATSTSFHRTCH